MMVLLVPPCCLKNAAWPLQCRISIARAGAICNDGVFAAPAATLWERDTMNRITAAVAGLSLAFVGTSASFAATINVPGDQPTISAAISASVNGDMINIAAGTYNEYNLNPGGKAITIQGTLNGDGSLATTIDGQQGGSVFTINGGEGAETVIQYLMITGGSSNYGGGIVVRNSSNPTISGCTISGNMADESGGGIFCDGSNPTISDCTIEGNTANIYAGGIWCNNSSSTISGCTIKGNTAIKYGGGIFCNDSSPTISGCTIEGNTGDEAGGGIFCNNSSPTISGCTIEGNTAENGGGIACITSSPTINGCTIEGNSADYGGGINCLINSNPTISGCTFTNNLPDTITGNFTMGEPSPSTGACCVSTGCESLSSDDCIALGGTWLGEGGSCDDCAPTCQGDTNGDGVVNVDDLLIVIANWNNCP